MTRNEMLKYTLVTKVLDCKATPSRKELQQKIATLEKAQPELVVIKKIITQFGKNKVEVIAHVYDSEKALKAAEPAYMVERNKIVVASDAPAE